MFPRPRLNSFGPKFRMQPQSTLNYLLLVAVSLLPADLLSQEKETGEIAAKSIFALAQEKPLTPDAWKSIERTIDLASALPLFLKLVDELDEVGVDMRNTLLSLESMQPTLNKWDRGLLACLIELSYLQNLFDTKLPVADPLTLEDITSRAIAIIGEYLLDSLPHIPTDHLGITDPAEDAELKATITYARGATKVDLLVQRVRNSLYWIQKNTENQLSRDLLDKASPKAAKTIKGDLAVPNSKLLSDRLLDVHRKKFMAQIAN